MKPRMRHVIFRKRRLVQTAPVKRETLSLERTPAEKPGKECESLSPKVCETPQVNFEELGNLWKKFDYIAVLCFTGYKDRQTLLAKELSRVGIKNAVYHWDFPSPYKEVLQKNVPMTRFNANNGCFFIGHNHYRAIATAYHLGCRKCLVIEDDIRFLKNLDIIRNSLSSLPEDFNIALLDSNKPCCLTEEGYKAQFADSVNEYWSRFDCLGSAGCYALDRVGMAKMISLMEAPIGRQGVLHNIDHYFRKAFLGQDCRMYVARPQLAIQNAFETRHYSRMDEYYKRRELIGNKRDDYGEEDVKDEDRMEIVFVGDQNYIKYLRMSAATYLAHNPSAHITYVSPTKVSCPKGVDNFIIEPPKNMRHRRFDRITDATYVKLMLTQLPYHKILLVDADTLCLKSLDELWYHECNYISLCESHLFGKKQAAEYGHAKYGLSGVMLMNLDALREDSFTQKSFVPFDTSFISLWCHEESILNYRFYDKLDFVDVKYNYCYNRKYEKPLHLSDVAIMHFPGKHKANMIRLFGMQRGVKMLI